MMYIFWKSNDFYEKQFLFLVIYVQKRQSVYLSLLITIISIYKKDQGKIYEKDFRMLHVNDVFSCLELFLNNPSIKQQKHYVLIL
jgi:hypothetical protein